MFLNKMNLKTKQIKYGSYSIATTFILIGILIIANLLVSEINLKFDYTKNNLYSLSDKTNDILSNITEDIEIFVLEESGKENKLFMEILAQYENASSKVTVTYMDPILYPLFADAYVDNDEAVNIGSIIVQGSDKFKIIDVYDLYNVAYDSKNNPVVQSYVIEEEVTNAIVYVESESDPVVNIITGHNEMEVPSLLLEQLDKENFITHSVSVLETTLDPKEDILLFMSPQLDLMDEELTILTDFFIGGGKALFMLDFSIPSLPNYEHLLDRYGIQIERGIVFEGQEARSYPGYPNFLFPYVAKHDITHSLIDDNIPVLFPLSMNLKESKLKSLDTTVTPLFITSENAYLKTNLDTSTYEKTIDDVEGPLTLALCSYVNNNVGSDASETKLIVIGTTTLLDADIIPLESLGNIDFVMDSFSWLTNKSDTTYLRPKSVDSYQIILTSQQLILIGLTFTILLPSIIIIYGIVIWLRRRHL